MLKFEFKTLKFKERGNKILGIFYNMFYFEIYKEEIRDLAPFEVKDGVIIFYSKKENYVKNRFLDILYNKIHYEMKSLITGRKATYIDFDFLPLLGTLYFGFRDWPSNVIEVRPITGCLNQCIFCSVREGPREKYWIRDFIVQREYLVEEAKRIVKLKEVDEPDFYINPQGEPILYPELTELIQDLSEIGRVGITTTLVGVDLKDVEGWIEAGLSYINLSIHTLDPKKAKILVGNHDYDLEKVLWIIENINGKVEITLTPVIFKWNLEDLEKLIEFAKKLKNKWRLKIVPQIYMVYKHGRKLRKELRISKQEFIDYLKKLEKKYNIKLINFDPREIGIKKGKMIRNPFRKGMVLKAEPIVEGRRRNEYLTKFKNWTISVYSKNENFQKIRIKEIKGNIIIAEAIS